MKNEVTKQDVMYYTFNGNSNLLKVLSAAGKERKLKALRKTADSLAAKVVDEIISGYLSKQDIADIQKKVKLLNNF